MSRNNVEMFLHLQINVLKYFGVWSPRNGNILYFIYMCFALALEYVTQVLFWMYIITTWGDLEVMTGGLNYLTSHFVACMKITTIVVNRNAVTQLLDFMNSDIFSSKLTEHYKIRAEQARKMRRVFISMLMVFSCSLVAFTLTPVFSHPRAFPFNMWMPVDPNSSPGFEIGCVYQFICGLHSSYVFPAVDFIIITVIMFGSAQLDIIKNKLQQIKGIPQSASPEKLTSIDTQRLMTENNDLLIGCINHHRAVKRFVEATENCFNVLIFAQTAGTVEIVCIIAFRLSVEQSNTVQFYSALAYMVNILGQLYFVCWSGNELTTRSEEVRDVLYQCPWYDQDRQFKRTLMIAMVCMKKPIVLRAGYFITLSRSTFVSILRLSYSYFAVLNHVNDKK